MSGREGRIIRSCGEIAPGAEIEAWRQGRQIHRGRVSETVPSMGMFWIIDARNGTRELLDAPMPWRSSNLIRRRTGGSIAGGQGPA